MHVSVIFLNSHCLMYWFFFITVNQVFEVSTVIHIITLRMNDVFTLSDIHSSCSQQITLESFYISVINLWWCEPPFIASYRLGSSGFHVTRRGLCIIYYPFAVKSVTDSGQAINTTTCTLIFTPAVNRASHEKCFVGMLASISHLLMNQLKNGYL